MLAEQVQQLGYAPFEVQNLSIVGAGVIGIKNGVVRLSAAGVVNATLAAPIAGPQSAGGDDGKILTIISESAQAHTVTQAAPGFNGGGAASDVGTGAGAKGDTLIAVALGGVWYAIQLKGYTLA